MVTTSDRVREKFNRACGQFGAGWSRLAELGNDHLEDLRKFCLIENSGAYLLRIPGVENDDPLYVSSSLHIYRQLLNHRDGSSPIKSRCTGRKWDFRELEFLYLPSNHYASVESLLQFIFTPCCCLKMGDITLPQVQKVLNHYEFFDEN